MPVVEKNLEPWTPERARQLHAADTQTAGLADQPSPSDSKKGNPHQARGPPELNDDLLWGGQAVADFLGISLDKLYYLVRSKKLPISKLGRKTIIASKKRLQRAIDSLSA